MLKCIFLCVALACLTSAASSKTYSFGFFQHPPWFEKAPHGYRGLLVETVKRVFAQKPLQGTHIRFKVLPLRRLLAGIKHGTLDMAWLLRTPQREKFAVFSVPPLITSVCVYTKEGNPHLKAGTHPFTLKALKNRPLRAVGVSGNGWFQKYVARNKGQLNISYAKDTSKEILWVLNGRADFLIKGEESVKFALAGLRQKSRLLLDKSSRLVPLPVTFQGQSMPMPFIISKRSPLAKQLDKVNEAIALTLQSLKKAGKAKEACTTPL